MLTAIVPATNRPATLGRCLAAIEAASDPPEELIVVEQPPWAGPAGARNEGALRAAGDVLVFIDADVEVHPNAFLRIRAAFDRDPKLTAVFGSYDDAPSAPGVVSVFRNLLHHYIHQTSAGPSTSFWAGLGAMRRDAFAASGGFDAARFPAPSIEDIELGMRLAATGARIRLDPQIAGKHLKAWELWDMVKTDFARRGVPWIELLLERRLTSTALNLGWRHRLSAFLSLLFLFGTLKRRPALAAGSIALLIALNRYFYGLLFRRLGATRTMVAFALHVLHHLTALAAVPAGILAHAARSIGGSPAIGMPFRALPEEAGRVDRLGDCK